VIGLARTGLEWALSSSRLTVRRQEPEMSDRSFVVYYRVSTPEQGRSRLGLEAQGSAVERFVARWRGRVILEHTEIESGKKCGRPELRKALGACRVFGATLLIANIDRLARNAAFVAMLIETGVDFVAVDFPQANSFDKHILAAFAENELKQMSDRRRAVCAVMKARGFKFGQHLKGSRIYRPDDLTAARAALVRSDTERAIALAPLLRELRDKGKSINGIVDELARLEIESPRGGALWHASSVRRLFLLAGEEPPCKRVSGGASIARNRDLPSRTSRAAIS
jgi:DNA invertase Pin-like site-specific DNA recombinase